MQVCKCHSSTKIGINNIVLSDASTNTPHVTNFILFVKTCSPLTDSPDSEFETQFAVHAMTGLRGGSPGAYFFTSVFALGTTRNAIQPRLTKRRRRLIKTSAEPITRISLTCVRVVEQMESRTGDPNRDPDRKIAKFQPRHQGVSAATTMSFLCVRPPPVSHFRFVFFFQQTLSLPLFALRDPLSS